VVGIHRIFIDDTKQNNKDKKRKRTVLSGSDTKTENKIPQNPKGK
jgi:hypothetical protein